MIQNAEIGDIFFTTKGKKGEVVKIDLSPDGEKQVLVISYGPDSLKRFDSNGVELRRDFTFFPEELLGKEGEVEGEVPMWENAVADIDVAYPIQVAAAKGVIKTYHGPDVGRMVNWKSLPEIIDLSVLGLAEHYPKKVLIEKTDRRLGTRTGMAPVIKFVPA
jgi:hypothetical protein